jgi:protein-tyrosine phosphatase
MHGLSAPVDPRGRSRRGCAVPLSFQKGNADVFKRILIVCIGNICRSPTAEYILRQRLAGRDLEVVSAGLGALVARPMDPLALQLLQEHGIDGAAHRARQLTEDMLRHADLVLGMEAEQVAAIRRVAPEASGKTLLFGKWDAGVDIPDPYRQQRPAFEHVYGLIARAADSWLRYL